MMAPDPIENFPITNGVRRECVLAPTLFRNYFAVLHYIVYCSWNLAWRGPFLLVVRRLSVQPIKPENKNGSTAQNCQIFAVCWWCSSGSSHQFWSSGHVRHDEPSVHHPKGVLLNNQWTGNSHEQAHKWYLLTERHRSTGYRTSSASERFYVT